MIYTHALGIDHPLSVSKDGVAVMPHQNWSGQYDVGTLANGASTRTCSGGSSCPIIDWPGGARSIDGENLDPKTVTTWYGNLVSNKTDGSGLQYMRNRYYDPKTGRFTQQDPIGLGGGLNAYGFASGDPVTLSDPFGLCKPWPTCLLAALGTAVVADAAPAAPSIPSATIVSPYIVAAGLGYLTLSPAFPEDGVPVTQPGAAAAGADMTVVFQKGSRGAVRVGNVVMALGLSVNTMATVPPPLPPDHGPCRSSRVEKQHAGSTSSAADGERIPEAKIDTMTRTRTSSDSPKNLDKGC